MNPSDEGTDITDKKNQNQYEKGIFWNLSLQLNYKSILQTYMYLDVTLNRFYLAKYVKKFYW